MTKEEIEKEWQDWLKSLLDKFNEEADGMTPEEEKKYVKENKLNEKINAKAKELQERLKKIESEVDIDEKS